ncbi:MAG: diacylglycerol kinase family protein [bacterium]
MIENKYLFVINPVSGKGNALHLVKKVFDNIKDFLNYDVFITTPEHYANVVRQLINREKFTHVIAVGGDGTANEVLNAVIGTNAVMGILPFGSGNDFARNLDLPSKIKDIIEMLISNKIKKIDCGKAGNTYFLNYISFGLDSEINRKAELYKSSLPAETAYIIAVFHALIRHKSKHLIINGELKHIHLLAIHNGRFYGGGIPMNPRADCTDGKLNLIYVDKMWKIKILLIFPTIFMGLHHKFKEVHFSKITKINIDTKDHVLIALDGENIDVPFPLNIEVQPQAVNFLYYQSSI